MRRVAVLSFAACVLAATAAAAASVELTRSTAISSLPVLAQSPTTTHSPTVIQSAEEALARDLALTAKGNGWTLDEAAAQHDAAQIIGRIAERVAEERPEIFVGAAVSTQPGGAPTLYIKGPADQFIRDLVAQSGIEVIVADNQPFSFAELEARVLRLRDALVAIGFRTMGMGVDITRGRISATVSVQAGVPVTAAAILSTLPEDLRSGVELTIKRFTVARDTGPLALIPPSGTDPARAEGTLRITERCVYLRSAGKQMLLFWPADRTRWNGRNRAITFSNFDGTVVTVRDRDAVVLGGGGDSEAESGISAREWVRRTVWVAPPDASCSAEVRSASGSCPRRDEELPTD